MLQKGPVDLSGLQNTQTQRFFDSDFSPKYPELTCSFILIFQNSGTGGSLKEN
jgi:hypothetical protein